MVSDQLRQAYLATTYRVFTDQEVIDFYIGNESTLIDYSYEMKTDHWLINKIIAASSVFDNMHENIINLLEQIEKQTTGDGNIQANTPIH